MTIPTAPRFARPVAFCGASLADDASCRRLPAHHGDHSPFVRGNGIPQPKAAKADRRAAKPKTRVIDGVTYRLVAVREPNAVEPSRRHCGPSSAGR